MFAALLLPQLAIAVPVTLNRQDASNLHTALNSVQDGLSPADTVAAADDINILRPVAEALQRGQVAASRKAAVLPETPDKPAKQIALVESIEAKAQESITLDLTPIDITADEIKSAHINAGTLAILRRFLLPTSKK